jgi:hypothetical protein
VKRQSIIQGNVQFNDKATFGAGQVGSGDNLFVHASIVHLPVAGMSRGEKRGE